MSVDDLDADSEYFAMMAWAERVHTIGERSEVFWQVGAGVSSVWGRASAIEAIQRSSTHYFQRPDATHVEVDPTRTSLSGHGGTVDVGKGDDLVAIAEVHEELVAAGRHAGGDLGGR